MKSQIIIFLALLGSTHAAALSVNATLQPLAEINVSRNVTAKNATFMPATRAPHAVSAKPTTMPKNVTTMAPTDSPAPSPSPSEAPSIAPTKTTEPTLFPSLMPTDSPAPSPGPSQMPSLSPSAQPSRTPSSNPSGNPSSTPSLTPSRSPSTAPSKSSSPSLAPSLSQAPTSPTSRPSKSPSDVPSLSPSIEPSFSPTTEMVVQSARDSITFQSLGEFMDQDVIAVFEQQTKEFIQFQVNANSSFPGVDIIILSVTVYEQTILPGRRLSGRNLASARGFRVRYEVLGEVRPGLPPAGFVFANTIGQPFHNKWLVYINLLAVANPFFKPLLKGDAATTNAYVSQDQGGGGSKAGAGTYAGIVVGVLGAIALALVAAIYAIRVRQRDSNGVSRGAKLDVAALDRCDSHSTAMTPYGANDSPASIESGIVLPTNKDTKESREVVTEMAKTRSLLDSMVNNSASSDTEEVMERHDMGLNLSNNVLGAHACSSRSVDPPPSECHQVPSMGSSFCYSDDESVNLTPVSFMQSMRGTNGTPDLTTSVLGARPMEHRPIGHDGKTNDSQGVSSQEGSPAKRSGLYDVFAPSGPLGIVVDTTRDGPVVHSMKPTSPLLGLISPGDLIVGLDDADTRSMTAATLTRAMAKLSHQPERKITLLAVDSSM